MKKMFVMAAMATIVFAGCVKNEPASVPAVSGEQEIAFESPVIAPTVKSVNEIAAFPEDATFHVWAAYTAEGTYNFSTSPKYMDADVARVQAGEWKTVGKKYYWPKGGSLTFGAYYPSDVLNASYVESGLKITGYTVGSDDLLYSELAADKKATDGKVVLTFNHALSSLVFTASLKEDYKDITIKLKSITLKGVHKMGDFNQSVGSNPAWTATDDRGDIQLLKDASIVLTNTKTYLPGTMQDADYSKRQDNKSDLFVMPQDIDQEATQLEVVYTVTTVDDFTYEEKLPVKVTNTNVRKWEPGKRYTYNLMVSLTEVSFGDPLVTPWEAEDYQPGLEF